MARPINLYIWLGFFLAELHMARPINPSDLLAPPPPMDPPSDRREIVIEVNHGNTLRRIGAFVHGQLMDHNVNELRAKIISLFKFSHDADFILTYTDEGGDVVTLDDDDKLRDAVIAQRLNPLRINIKLKFITIVGIDARSEASSLTASNSPESGTKPLNIQSAIDEALESVPEHFRSAISDLLDDIFLKLSTPPFAQFVENFSKLAFSNASHHSDGITGDLSGQTGNVDARFEVEASILTVVEEALKSVPEPVRSAISDLMDDIGLKISTSEPPFCQFVENLCISVLSNASHHFGGITGDLSGQTGNVPAKETNTTAPFSPLGTALLKKLDEMSFNQNPLTMEILRRNNYDLEQCLDDPDIFAEDLLLSVMEEMGFSDRELNIKMLKKNGGRIKRAVSDLVAGEKL